MKYCQLVVGFLQFTLLCFVQDSFMSAWSRNTQQVPLANEALGLNELFNLQAAGSPWPRLLLDDSALLAVLAADGARLRSTKLFL